MASLPSRNPLPGSPTGMATQSIPGDPTGATTQTNVPKDWADIYDAQGLYGSGGKPTGDVSGMIGSGGGSGPGGMEGELLKTGLYKSGNRTNPQSPSYSWQTGSGSSSGGGNRGGSGAGSGSGSGGRGSSLGGVSNGIARVMGSSGGGGGSSSSGGDGLNLAGLSGAFGSSPDPGPEVGMDAGGSDPLDIAPPKTPGPDIGVASQGAGNTQQLSGPGGLRPGLGSRIYPALDALLKSPAY